MRPPVLFAAALALALPLAPALAPALAPGDGDLAFSHSRTTTDDGQEPVPVLAHIDTGINPYHETFRDDSPTAQQHPSTYLPGYPEDARKLDLTLSVGTVDEGLETDADAWAQVRDAPNGTLWWVPGTRIVGLVSMGSGGTDCAFVGAPPANLAQDDGCTDHPLVDDHGHGTMTASRMAAGAHSLSPDARIVSIEGLGADGVRWAAEQSWIDAQSNSWVSFVPPPADQHADDAPEVETPLGNVTWGPSTVEAFRYAAQRQVVIAASGNGAAYTQGHAPTPTQMLSTGAPGVILVGAHDNGHVARWSGAPAHVVADGYAGWHASNTDNDAFAATPVACCTSAAAPYVAGAAGALVKEARLVLGNATSPLADGVLAVGDAVGVSVGPLADGNLTVPELRTVLMHTAHARPVEGPDDGLVHWTAELRPGEDPEVPDVPDDVDAPANVTRWGVGANPYCQGCTTDPVRWTEVPRSAPAFASIGFGSVDPGSVQEAILVLNGHLDVPDRPDASTFFAQDQAFRDAWTQDRGNTTVPPVGVGS